MKTLRERHEGHAMIVQKTAQEVIRANPLADRQQRTKILLEALFKIDATITSSFIRAKISSRYFSPPVNSHKIGMVLYGLIDEIGKNPAQYNSLDGMIECFQKVGLGDTSVRSLIYSLPRVLRKQLNNWLYTNLSANSIKRYRDLFQNMSEEEIAYYNTEDGLLRWCKDNNFTVNMENIFYIIPRKVHEKLNQWVYMVGNKYDIERIRNKLLNMTSEQKVKYRNSHGLYDYMYENGYGDIYMGVFWQYVPNSVRAEMGWRCLSGKYFNNQKKYYEEWKSILRTDIEFHTYIIFRSKGGTITDIEDIFPLETFFERSGKLNPAQVYLGLKLIGRNMLSLRRYQRDGTLGDRALGGAKSLDEKENGISRHLTDGKDLEASLMHADNTHHLQNMIRNLDNESIRSILARIFLIEDDGDGVSSAEIAQAVLYIRSHKGFMNLLRERISITV